MASYAKIGGLEVHPVLKGCVENEIIPGSGIAAGKFWKDLETLLREFTPKNFALLKKRDSIQAQIDAYLLERKGKEWDAGAYTSFLANIGYIVPEGPE